jgi:hypothetical protein
MTTYTLIFGKYGESPIYSRDFTDILSAVREATTIIEQWVYSPIQHPADYCRLYTDDGTILYVTAADIDTARQQR